MVISLSAEKTFAKIKFSFMIKIAIKLVVETVNVNAIKSSYS
jgi:hypothetical protein